MDLPAAHSMDTRWFAVDQDGCVAVFDTGETGCVAEDWEGGQSRGYALVERLLAAGLPMDLSRQAALPPSPEVRRFSDERPPGDWERQYDLLLRLAHPRVLDLLPGAQRLPAEAGNFAYLPYTVEPEALTPLLERGWIERVWCGMDRLVAVGVYLYECDWSHPYSRQGLPGRELKFQELPAEVRALAVVLPLVTFREEIRLDPSLLVPCRWYGGERP